LHVHFNGAGGNIGAGKYNDGAHENRRILAERLADGMKRAWEATKKEPITASDIQWTVEHVSLEPAAHLKADELVTALKTPNPTTTHTGAASRLAWVRRGADGRKLNVACLSLGHARILHMPGELFVEYQLYAKSLRPDLFVAMAAYGDYGPWYIGTATAYDEGGYETSPGATNVGPQAEAPLRAAIQRLLKN
jgi:hypothetical protein